MCERTRGILELRRIIKTESGGVRIQKERGSKRKKEKGMNKEKRSLVQECVRKRDGGNIYLSLDGSVLEVHLWRNEISS